MAERDGLAVGRRLLALMGYTGGGLGKNENGRETPIIPEVRPAKLGLGAKRARSPPMEGVERRGGKAKKRKATLENTMDKQDGPKARTKKRKVASDKKKPVAVSVATLRFVCPNDCGARCADEKRLNRHVQKCARKDLCGLCGRPAPDAEEHMRTVHGPAPEVVAILDRRESRHNGVSYFVRRADGSAKWEPKRFLKRASSFIESYEATFVIDVSAEGAPKVRARESVAAPPQPPPKAMPRRLRKRVAMSSSDPGVIDLTGDDACSVVLASDDEDDDVAKRPKTPVIDLTCD